MEQLENGSDALMTNLSKEAEDLLAYKVGVRIHWFYFPIISVVGIVSNIIALCILLQEKNRKYPCYRTLTALSVSDLIIIFSGIYNWIILLLDATTETNCKVWTYFFQTAALSSALMVAFLTVHKYLAFVAPFKSHNLRLPSRTLKIIVSIVIFSVLYNIAHVFGTNTIDGRVCVGITGHDAYNKVLTWIALAFHAILPVTFVATLNTLIVRAVHVSSKFYQQSSVRATSLQRKRINLTLSLSKKEKSKNPVDFNAADEPGNPLRFYDRPTATYHRQSSVLLVSVTCVFAVLSPPLYFCHLAYTFIDFRSSAEAYARYVLAFYICL